MQLLLGALLGGFQRSGQNRLGVFLAALNGLANAAARHADEDRLLAARLYCSNRVLPFSFSVASSDSKCFTFLGGCFDFGRIALRLAMVLFSFVFIDLVQIWADGMGVQIGG